MNTKLNFFHHSVLLVILGFPFSSQGQSQPLKALASESFQLASDMEVGLEIEARAPAASWLRKGAEASAILISVDGKYKQDLLLWAGDELFVYRVMLGRLP